MKKLAFLSLFLLPFSAFAQNDDCMTRTTVPDEKLTLTQIIELGLCRNPQTTASYLSYESARLSKNASYASYLPSVNVGANASLPYRPIINLRNFSFILITSKVIIAFLGNK